MSSTVAPRSSSFLMASSSRLERQPQEQFEAEGGGSAQLPPAWMETGNLRKKEAAALSSRGRGGRRRLLPTVCWPRERPQPVSRAVSRWPRDHGRQLTAGEWNSRRRVSPGSRDGLARSRAARPRQDHSLWRVQTSNQRSEENPPPCTRVSATARAVSVWDMEENREGENQLQKKNIRTGREWARLGRKTGAWGIRHAKGGRPAG